MKSARSHFGEVKYTAADKQMNHVENEKKWKRQTYEQWANGRALCLWAEGGQPEEQPLEEQIKFLSDEGFITNGKKTALVRAVGMVKLCLTGKLQANQTVLYPNTLTTSRHLSISHLACVVANKLEYGFCARIHNTMICEWKEGFGRAITG